MLVANTHQYFTLAPTVPAFISSTLGSTS
jgi:hypothetical protein